MMPSLQPTSGDETTISRHTPRRWLRRREELAEWIELPKTILKPKQLAAFGTIEVDVQMLPALLNLRSIEVITEFSCAGVSLKDDSVNHSLYAYVTAIDSEPARRFIAYLIDRMRHRILVTYEPERNRYDLSSFFIANNRSFCFLLEKYAEQFAHEPGN